MLINIKNLIDDAKCYEAVRYLRWPDKPRCPFCDSEQVIKRGFDEKEISRQSYKCKDCVRRFDDLTGTVFAGRHQSLKVWILCLYFMGLNLSNTQISKELELNRSDVQQMTERQRGGIVDKKPRTVLQGETECDEVYIVAGHKGNPSAAADKGRKGRRNRLKGARGRGTLEKEKPPVIGMVQRGGEAVIRMLSNVRQKTIEPLIKETVMPGTLIYTDEYNIYSRLEEWGYGHETVNHSAGEFAGDDDGDGFCEVNTIEGFRSLLRSWLRPHRGISQEKLPLYLTFRSLKT